MVKNASDSTSSGFGVSPFSLKKVEIKHCGFVLLPVRTDAAALPKKVFLRLKALFTFPTKSFLSRFALSNPSYHVYQPSMQKQTGLTGTPSSLVL